MTTKKENILNNASGEIQEDIMKKGIAPRLRTMKIGEWEIYPAIRKTSVESTKNRLQMQFRHIGLKFSMRSKGNEVIVTRIN